MRKLVKHALRVMVAGLSVFSFAQFVAAQMTKDAPTYHTNKTGIGPSISTISGIGLYRDINSKRFVQGNVGVDSEERYDFSADYCIRYPIAFGNDGDVAPFWGIGVTQLHDTDDRLSAYFDEDGPVDATGVRVPLGVNAKIVESPLLVSMDVAPTVLVAPASASFVRGNVSLRVLF